MSKRHRFPFREIDLGIAERQHLARVGNITLTIAVIGYLGVRSLTDVRANAEGFRRGLAEHGFVEGQNIRIEYRAADGRYDRLPALAAELVNLGVSLFVATGGELVALAAKAASPAIPLVFVVGS